MFGGLLVEERRKRQIVADALVGPLDELPRRVRRRVDGELERAAGNVVAAVRERRAVLQQA